MGRRRFDHLFIEVSLALDAAIPRYAMWLALHDQGFDPEGLSAEQATAFCGGPLRRFLSEHGYWLSPQNQLRVRRAVERYDPAVRTPEEHFARF